MRAVLQSVIELFIMFLLLTGLGAVFHLSSFAIKMDSVFTNILVYLSVLILLGIFVFRVSKRHHLKKSILISTIVIIVCLSSVLPDQIPTLLHTTTYTYTFGFPLPFLTIHSDTDSGFLLQQLSLNHSYAIDTMSLIANIFLVYLLLTCIRHLFEKSQQYLVKL